jgi:hypothetical protein
LSPAHQNDRKQLFGCDCGYWHQNAKGTLVYEDAN